MIRIGLLNQLNREEKERKKKVYLQLFINNVINIIAAPLGPTSTIHTDSKQQPVGK